MATVARKSWLNYNEIKIWAQVRFERYNPVFRMRRVVFVDADGDVTKYLQISYTFNDTAVSQSFVIMNDEIFYIEVGDIYPELRRFPFKVTLAEFEIVSDQDE